MFTKSQRFIQLHIPNCPVYHTTQACSCMSAEKLKSKTYSKMQVSKLFQPSIQSMMMYWFIDSDNEKIVKLA